MTTNKIGGEAADYFRHMQGAMEFLTDVGRILELGYGIAFANGNGKPGVVGLTGDVDEGEGVIIAETITPDYVPDAKYPWEATRAIRVTVERLSREAEAIQSGVAHQGEGVGEPSGVRAPDGERVRGEGGCDTAALAGPADEEGGA